MALIVVVLTAAATGCGVQGYPGPERVDLNALDTGVHSRLPMPEPTEDNEKYGRVLESVRMGEAMAGPAEVDPTLIYPGVGFGGVPLSTPAAAVSFLALPVRTVLERYGLIAGFAVSGSDRSLDDKAEIGTVRLLTVLVLRFPEPTAARRAASEIDSVDAAISADNVAVEIPGYGGAHAHWRPKVPTMAVSIAQESFVVSLLVGHTAPDLGALTTLARRALDLQIPRLRAFTATPRDEIAALPLDQEGMLARMVPPAPRRWPYPGMASFGGQGTAGWDSLGSPTGVVYGPHAAELLLGSSKPERPERVAFNGLEILFRYSDVVQARKVFVDVPAVDEQAGTFRIPSPVAIADVSCVESPETAKKETLVRYSCAVLHGRYLAVLHGRDLTDFRRRVAAQYALLVNSGSPS